jgi:hypothetical protein
MGAFIDQTNYDVPPEDDTFLKWTDGIDPSIGAYITQTFTPSAAAAAYGPLGAVWLDVWEGTTGSKFEAKVEIYAAAGDGKPTGPMLAESAFEAVPASAGTYSHPDSSGYVFELTDPYWVSSSQEYAILAKAASDGSAVSFRYDPAGNYGGDFGRFDGFGWNLQTGDLAFDTRHVPEPGTIAGLLSMGAMVLVYTGWRRRRAKRAAA